MSIAGFDHVALPARDPEALIAFYHALGFDAPDAAEWRERGVPFFEVRWGRQKINFHAPALWQQPGFTLRGPAAAPGCGDLCFVWEGGADALRARLESAGATPVAGPVEVQGARGRGSSTYLRDPDGNLLEFIVYPAG